MSSPLTSSRPAGRPLRVILIGILTAALGLGLASLGAVAPASADDPTGTISGTITDVGATGIPNINVWLQDVPTGTGNDGGVIGSEETNGTGHFSMSDIPVGTYRLTLFDPADDPVYLEATIPNVVVTDGAETIANGEMTKGGQVTGQVVDNSNTPLNNVPVTSDNEAGGITTTADDGTFTLTGLSYGPHEIYINTEQPNRDVGDGSNDFNIKPGYTPAHVRIALVPTDSAPVSISPVALYTPSTISGILLSASGAPLSHVFVDADLLDADGTVEHLTVDSGHTVETSSTGAFSIPNLPLANVYLHFTPESGTPASAAYEPQYLGGSSDINLSTPIAITLEQWTYFRDIRLVSNSAVTGKVTNKVTGAALKNVLVDAEPLVAGSSDSVDTVKQLAEGIGGKAMTNSKGAFTIPGLPAGSYQVTYNSEASGPALASSDTSSTQFYVPLNTTVSHSMALAQRTKVSGTVRDATNLRADIQVDAFVYNTISSTVGPAPSSFGRDTTMTNSNGTYTLYLDPAKTYIIRFTDLDGVDGVSYLGGGIDPTDALTTKLAVGKSSLTGKNVTLGTEGGQVTAGVLDSNGNPADSDGTAVLSRLTGPDGNVTGDVVSVSEIGELVLTNLADGSYQLLIAPEPVSQNYTIAPTIVDFTLTGGVITEINGLNPTDAGTSLGYLTLNAPVYVPDPQYTVGGNLPSISSTTNLHIGDLLTVDDGDWSPAPPQFFHQWYRDGRPISGATGESHTITAGDVGKKLSVGLFFSDPNIDGQEQPDAMTAQTDAVSSGDIAAPITPPTISGVQKVGQTLTAHPGTWSSPALGFNYQWIRLVGATPNVVSTALTYKTVAADYGPGTFLLLAVTASQPGYDSATAESALATIALANAAKLTVSPKIVHVAVTNNYGVTTGTWSPSGTTETYQWVVHDPTNDAPSDGPTTNTFPSAPSNVRIQVIVTASKAGYTPASVTLAVQTGPAANISGGSVNITGATDGSSSRIGFPLTADVSGLTASPTDATYAYQWYRGTSKISGATTSVYTPTTADVTKLVSARVTPIAAGYAAGTAVVSPAVTVETAGSFGPTGSPSLTGTQAVGRTLTAVPGTFIPAATSVTFQWYRISSSTLVHTKITGATKSTYLIGSADLANFLEAHITYGRAGYASTFTDVTTSAIANFAIQNVTPPSLGASAQVGAKLTASTGTWDVASTTYTYQWLDDGVDIVGATASTFVPSVSDYGDDITVEVVAHRSGFGSSAAATSPPLTVQLGTAAAASGVPKLSVAGKTVTSLKQGTTVAATMGTWSTPGLVFSYQWQVNRNDGNGFVDFAAQDSMSNTLYLDTVGNATSFALLYSYRVVVTAERAGYLPALPITSGALTITS